MMHMQMTLTSSIEFSYLETTALKPSGFPCICPRCMPMPSVGGGMPAAARTRGGRGSRNQRDQAETAAGAQAKIHSARTHRPKLGCETAVLLCTAGLPLGAKSRLTTSDRG